MENDLFCWMVFWLAKLCSSKNVLIKNNLKISDAEPENVNTSSLGDENIKRDADSTTARELITVIQKQRHLTHLQNQPDCSYKY
jgi:hypothetical protein